jgi:hypothetical protein
MIYSSKVFAFAFIIELNILTWASRSTSFLNSRYLKATLFGLIKWPFMWLGIPWVMIDGYQYPPFGFSAFILLYLPTAIELIVVCMWFCVHE